MKSRQIAPRRRDKKSRPRLTERQVLEVLLRQGAVIPCGICRLAFTIPDIQYAERDHERCEHSMHEDDVATGEWEKLEAHRYVHGRRDPRHPCHADKTRQDRKIKAKSDRIRGVTKQGPKAKIRSRPFPTPEQRQALREKYAR
jgi:hypothetical protein